MSDKIKALFDFQKFEENPKLNKVINESRMSKGKLDLDELSQISAAGEPDADTMSGSANRGDCYYPSKVKK